ncbi:MAG: hypothetical protein ACRDQB_03255, partial [Thermocrispum sp.]
MNPDPDVGAEDPRARRDPKVVIALLVVLVVATAVISSLLRPDEVGRPPRQESPGRAAPPDTFTVDQADSDHVFVIRHSCGDSIEGCSQSLLSSADSGAHWTERAIPEQVSGPGKLVARLSALGECAVAVDGDAGYADDPTGEFRLHTADCGRSWSPVSLRVDRTVDVIPTDATLAPCRVERAADRCSHGVIVTLPH